MVVEHSFITTLEAADAMRVASDLLTARGFQVEADRAFALDGSGWNTLEVHRGKANPARAKSALEVPQRVRLEWDRGRVTLAASSYSVSAADQNKSFQLTASSNQRRLQDQRELLLAIAHALEMALAQRRPDPGAEEWDRVEQGIGARAAASRQRMRTLTIIVGVLALLAVAILVIAMWAQPH